MNLPTSPRPRARSVTLGVAVLAASGLIAACGSASSSSSSAAASTTSTSTVASATGSGASGFSARRAALVACLKQHGVTLPSRPPGSGSGRSGTSTAPPPGGGFFGGGGGGRFRQAASNPKVQAALKACGANFRAGAGRGFGRISHQAVNNYVTCVRQHGFNMPAPNFSGKGSVFPASIRSNPKFQAASRQCQSLLIPRRSGSSSSGGATAGA